MEDFSGLKAGDKVVVCRGLYDKTIEAIDKITPTGIIKIGTSSFTPQGRQKGSQLSWNSSRLQIITSEIENKILCKEAVSQCRNVKELTVDQARAILEILNAHDPQGAERGAE